MVQLPNPIRYRIVLVASDWGSVALFFGTFGGEPADVSKRGRRPGQPRHRRSRDGGRPGELNEV
jgi:hypothetical protein